jgi:hypothetical protein
LDQADCVLGWKQLTPDKPVVRRSVIGSSLSWVRNEGYHTGELRLDIENGTLLECFLSYHGVLHHRALVGDPSVVPNPISAAYASFDAAFDSLRYQLFEEGRPRKDARHFEQGVSALLHMLGFSALHIGSAIDDAPDILAVTPRGQIVAVECTTGLLDQGNKLSKLVRRTELLRRSLLSSGARNTKVVAIIVSALGMQDVRADFQKAHEHGVLVLCNEELRDLVARSFTQQDPDALLQEGFARMEAASDQRSFWKR